MAETEDLTADLDAQPSDFVCLKEWPKVRAFHITNLMGRLDEALAVAEGQAEGPFPPGTIIQLVPTEAMVKRHQGWNPDTEDWEFFEFDVSESGTTIRARGAKDVVNRFGGNCLGCHIQADPERDLVCERGHGCPDVPITREQIAEMQRTDPRCG